MKIDWLSARYLSKQNRSPGRVAARFVVSVVVITTPSFPNSATLSGSGVDQATLAETGPAGATLGPRTS